MCDKKNILRALHEVGRNYPTRRGRSSPQLSSHNTFTSRAIHRLQPLFTGASSFLSFYQLCFTDSLCLISCSCVLGMQLYFRFPQYTWTCFNNIVRL